MSGARATRITCFSDALAAARDGEAIGFEWLFHSFGRRLHGFVCSRGCTEPDDVTGESFTAAFRSLESFSGGEDQFVSWLFRIARNRIIDHVRLADRRPQLAFGGVVNDRVADIDVEETVLSSLAGSDAEALLDGLTPDQRDVLLLRFVSDLSLVQTAEVMGRRPNAIKALQHRAISAVHRKLSSKAVTQ